MKSLSELEIEDSWAGTLAPFFPWCKCYDRAATCDYGFLKVSDNDLQTLCKLKLWVEYYSRSSQYYDFYMVFWDSSDSGSSSSMPESHFHRKFSLQCSCTACKLRTQRRHGKPVKWLRHLQIQNSWKCLTSWGLKGPRWGNSRPARVLWAESDYFPQPPGPDTRPLEQSQECFLEFNAARRSWVWRCTMINDRECLLGRDYI